VICLDPLGQGVVSNIWNIFESTLLVLLSKLSRSIGFRDLDDRRRSSVLSGGGGEDSPFGEEMKGSVAPFGEEGCPPPFGDDEGLIEEGSRNDAVGPSLKAEGKLSLISGGKGGKVVDGRLSMKARTSEVESEGASVLPPCEFEESINSEGKDGAVAASS
jgi:hypothetical protein